jgi:hypothetical protein
VCLSRSHTARTRATAVTGGLREVAGQACFRDLPTSVLHRC